MPLDPYNPIRLTTNLQKSRSQQHPQTTSAVMSSADPVSPGRLLRELFDLIDDMKKQGLHRILNLPQVVVSGDQSSGKSSVLGAITRLNFPTKDTVCTMFAIELEMRRTPPGTPGSLSVEIVPCSDHTPEEITRLKGWKPTIEDLTRFPEIVAQAGAAMYPDAAVATFSDDILRVQLSGPELQNLDLVDLPGIFHAAGPGQKSADVDKVKDMVGRYMCREWTVVLAIVSAKEDLAGQVVTALIKENMAEDRALAIITKPDTLDEEPNKRREYLKAMQNDTPELVFGLGWHVLRNKKFTEQSCTWEERDATEATFFDQAPWKEVPPEFKGIRSLVKRLQKTSMHGILAAFGSIRPDLERKIRRCREQLQQLKPATISENELATVQQDFHRLFALAVRGQYTHDFFRKSPDGDVADKKLEATLNQVVERWRRGMKQRGHTFEIGHGATSTSPPQGTSHPTVITRSEYIDLVIDRSNSMNAMPGQFVPEVFDDLFYEQTRGWPALVRHMVDEVVEATRRCVVSVLDHVCGDGLDRDKFFEVAVKPALDTARAKLDRYTDSRLQPFTARSDVTLDVDIRNRVMPEAFKDEWRRAVTDSLPGLVDMFKDLRTSSVSRLDDQSQGQLGERVADLVLANVTIQSVYGAVVLAGLEQHYKVQLDKITHFFDVGSIQECFLRDFVTASKAVDMADVRSQLATLDTEDVAVSSQRAYLTDRGQELQRISSRIAQILADTVTPGTTKRALSPEADGREGRRGSSNKKSRREQA